MKCESVDTNLSPSPVAGGVVCSETAVSETLAAWRRRPRVFISHFSVVCMKEVFLQIVYEVSRGVWGCPEVYRGVQGCMGTSRGVWGVQGCMAVSKGVWGCPGVYGGVQVCMGCQGVYGVSRGVWWCPGVYGGAQGCMGCPGVYGDVKGLSLIHI